MSNHTRDKKLLVIDGAVNLLLGVLLLCFPLGIATWLGVPEGGLNFYPGILGAVLFGIGIALLLEAYGQENGIRGLGLEGAIAINFCGAGALVIWMLVSSFEIPVRGYVTLWTIAIAVLAVGFVELYHMVSNPAGKNSR